MVDWSASSTPKTGKDSIWIAELQGETGRTRFSNPSTRMEAFETLSGRLNRLRNDGKRVLLGFDFSLGYPTGTSKSLGLKGVPWKAMLRWLANAIEDTPSNSNNRFDVASDMNKRISQTDLPFWGVTSHKHAGKYLSAKKPAELPNLSLIHI